MTAFELIVGNKNYSSWSMRAWLVATQAIRVTKQNHVALKDTVVPLDQDFRSNMQDLTPVGLVPVLKHGSVTVWDSLAIIEYLAEQFPDVALWPSDSATRAHARAVSAEMHSGFPALRQLMPMNIRTRKSRPVDATLDAEIARIETMWTALRDAHQSDGDFLFGPFSIADAMYAPVVTRFISYDVQLSGLAANYKEAIEAHQHVSAWTQDALAEPWVMEKYE